MEIVSSVYTWHYVLYIKLYHPPEMGTANTDHLACTHLYFFSLLRNVVDTVAYRGMERPGQKFVRKMSSLKS
jgi:hypothetical protein